jgi:hypothetical protein
MWVTNSINLVLGHVATGVMVSNHGYTLFLHSINTAYPWCHDSHKTNELHGLSPRANYTDRATASCRQSDCQFLRIEGATWST